MFLSRYSYDALAVWCRAIRHGHGAGLTLVKVFELQSRNGPQPMREAAARVARKLEAGTALEDALSAEGDAFPDLFITMATLGERMGQIPEVFGHLEEYYRLEASLRRDFRARIAWPIFQFVAGVLVIAFVIFLLGQIAESRGEQASAPIGFGLTGTSGAITFLIVIGSVVGAGIVAVKVMTKTVAQMAAFEAMLLRVPIIGPCMLAIAMGRFCLAMKLTLDSSLSVFKALRLSLKATSNGAFMAQEESIAKRVKKGDELADAIGKNPVFPADFLAALSVGEVSGQIPEVMAKQAAYYREETERQMKRVTWAASVLVYAGVAIFMIIAIFMMFSRYAEALKG